jgi:hypothetical protein
MSTQKPKRRHGERKENPTEQCSHCGRAVVVGNMRKHVSHSPACLAKSRRNANPPPPSSPHQSTLRSLHANSPAPDASTSGSTPPLDYEGDAGGFGEGTPFPFEGAMDMNGEMDIDVEMDLDDVEMDLDDGGPTELPDGDGVDETPLDVDEMNTQEVLGRMEEELVVEEFPTMPNGTSLKLISS